MDHVTQARRALGPEESAKLGNTGGFVSSFVLIRRKYQCSNKELFDCYNDSSCVKVKQHYSDVPIYIMANGVQEDPARFKDSLRVYYLYNYINEALKGRTNSVIFN